MLYLAKISGERLQDHWSSGFKCKVSFLKVCFCYRSEVNMARHKLKGKDKPMTSTERSKNIGEKVKGGSPMPMFSHRQKDMFSHDAAHLLF